LDLAQSPLLVVLPIDYCIMKKRKTVDLKSLWEKASKTRKVELGSTSIPEPVAVTSVVGSVAQPQDPPSVVLETIVSQVHNESIPLCEEQIEKQTWRSIFE